jgi:hypothetical protein
MMCRSSIPIPMVFLAERIIQICGYRTWQCDGAHFLKRVQVEQMS